MSSMYRSQYVLGVKNDRGQMLRESGGSRSPVVYLPFNSEYKLFLKNDRSHRCAVKISIDGTDVLGGQMIVIDGRSSIDLERFILDGNREKGKKFKFVPLSDSDVQYPSEPKNGLIEVEFFEELPNYLWAVYNNTDTEQFQFPMFTPPKFVPTPTCDPHFTPVQPSWTTCSTSNPSLKVNSVQNYSANEQVNVNFMRSMDMHAAPAASQAGATVEGSSSSQKFGSTSLGLLGTPVKMSVRISAPVQGQQTTVADTRNKYCPGCGRKMKASFKFCPGCGRNQG